MSWNVTQITTLSMTIQLTFDEPLGVSYREADAIVIEFADIDLFITRQGMRIKPKNRKLRRNLMRQLPPEAYDA